MLYKLTIILSFLEHAVFQERKQVAIVKMAAARVVVAHGLFNYIRQVAPICTSV